MKKTELDQLIKKIEQVNNIDWFYEKTRLRDNCNAKKMLSQILRKRCLMSLHNTAQLVYNNKDRHDAVINNLKKHDNFMDTEPYYRLKYKLVEEYYETIVLKSNWLPFRKSIYNSIKMQGV